MWLINELFLFSFLKGEPLWLSRSGKSRLQLAHSLALSFLDGDKRTAIAPAIMCPFQARKEERIKEMNQPILVYVRSSLWKPKQWFPLKFHCLGPCHMTSPSCKAGWTMESSPGGIYCHSEQSMRTTQVSKKVQWTLGRQCSRLPSLPFPSNHACWILSSLPISLTEGKQTNWAFSSSAMKNTSFITSNRPCYSDSNSRIINIFWYIWHFYKVSAYSEPELSLHSNYSACLASVFSPWGLFR